MMNLKIEQAMELLTCKVYLLIIVCLLPFGVFPQDSVIPPYSFQYLTSNDGLSQNTVDYIYKDSYGFMWFATWNGLCRYDGNKFRVYKANVDGSGLPNNFVHVLIEDQDQLLWVGTGEGLGVFDLTHERFCQLEPENIMTDQLMVNSFFIDREGTFYIGTENEGLLRLSSKKYDEEANILRFGLEKLGLFNVSVNTLVQIEEQKLLVGTSRGLFVYDTKKREVAPASDLPLAENISPEVMSLFFDENKHEIWIGTLSGLMKYNLKTNTSETFFYDSEDPSTISHNTISAISKDIEGNILIGTLGGLNIYQAQSGRLWRITQGSEHRNKLNNRFVNSIFTDQYANVWIGTDKGGVNKYNVFQKKFGAIVHDKGDPYSMSHPTVNSILPEKDWLWVGTAGGGLNMIERPSNRAVRHFKNDPNNPQSISSNFVTSIMRDRKRRLWTGTWGSGLNLLESTEKGQFRRFLADASDPDALSNNFISSIVEDPNGFFLVGTNDGLNVFYPEDEKFEEIPLEIPEGQSGVEVGCILLDRTGHYWVGTRFGLYRFLAKGIVNRDVWDNPGKIQYFRADKQDKKSLPGDYIISLKEDNRGRLWIGTYGNGIAYCTLEGKQAFDFHYYDEKDGLCNNVVYCIEIDEMGDLWLSTDIGLSRFDPETENFDNYYEVDGLLSNQFYWSASCKDRKGHLYFGSLEGLNFFDPSLMDDFPFQPQASLTDFIVLNNSVEIGQKRHGKVALEKTITEADTVFLSYKDNVFSIELSTLDYFLPNKIQFAYKMEGVDQDWVVVPASRSYVSYTNLRGGEYTFQVRASNGNGKWQQKPTSLTLIIRPPFWDTNWFRILVIAFLVLAVIGYIRWRTRYLNIQKKRLERQVQARTEEIETQKEQLKLQADNLKQTNLTLEQRQHQIEGQKRELEIKNQEISQQRDQLEQLNQQIQMVNQLRLRFFTNISHEFRTPLTLIIDPIESLLDRLKNDKQSLGTLHIIHRNAQRLLHLINQLMNFRRVEEGKVEVRVAQGDLIEFIRRIYQSFTDLAEHQKITYTFSYEGSKNPDTWFDAEKLENILYNLLSNAFKYTPENGKIQLGLFIEDPKAGKEEPPSFELKVSDTGIGIAKEHQTHIFDHFYRIPITENARIEGTGIGLALTSELVESLHGAIQLHSTPGKGTTFTLRIPYAKEAFDESEISYESRPRQFNLLTQVDLFREEMVAKKSSKSAKLSFPKRAEKDKPIVLIVEDNYDLRSFLVQSLNPYYRILEAENGKEGLELAKKYVPNLIISDIMMPFMDGMELCSRLKSKVSTSHIPIILLTAKTMVENWVEGLETGADDYVAKPFNLKILQARIDNLIKSREQLRQIFAQEPAPEAARVTSNSIDREFLEKAYQVLEEHFRHPEFSSEDFASKMYISRSLLYKKIKALTGMSITDFINSYKLKKSTALLRMDNRNIAEIAFEVGFNDPKYFSRVFKKYFGISPSDYLKGIQPPLSEQNTSSQS